ncbi:hypothetical protein [Kamptonema sp. PCC 6506]|uniref:hypothetical protein n=1 Tax=Kamptonema sp. PCC 6506 TaxID=272129 RepID=UPI0012F48A52|nr:hypothetical protein [Kamptonema sp. PCC 6506]
MLSRLKTLSKGNSPRELKNISDGCSPEANHIKFTGEFWSKLCKAFCRTKSEPVSLKYINDLAHFLSRKAADNTRKRYIPPSETEFLHPLLSEIAAVVVRDGNLQACLQNQSTQPRIGSNRKSLVGLSSVSLELASVTQQHSLQNSSAKFSSR